MSKLRLISRCVGCAEVGAAAGFGFIDEGEAAVEAVLGLSMTSTRVGWVLLAGSGADATTLDHDLFTVVAEVGVPGDITRHRAAVRGARAIATASGRDAKSVAVTWTDDVEAKAALLLKTLPALGFDKVVAVPPAETLPTPVISSDGAQLARAREAVLAMAARPEIVGQAVTQKRYPQPANRGRSRFRPHLRAATVVVAGVIALFAVGPELAGQPETRSTDNHPAADTSVISVPAATSGSSTTSVSVHAVPSPVALRPAPVVVHPPAVEPASVPTSSADAVAAVPVAAPEEILEEPATAQTVAGAPEPIAVPAAAPRTLDPVAPPGDPIGMVLSPIFGALP